MSKKLKIVTVILIEILLIIFTMPTYIYAENNTKETEESSKYNAELTMDLSEFDSDKSVEITMALGNFDKPISYLDCYLDYNAEVFEEVKRNDFTICNSDELSYYIYNAENKKLIIEYEHDTKDEYIFKLKLKVKENIEDLKKAYFSVKYISTYTYSTEETFEFNNISLATELYLSTNTYKIGKEDTSNYSENDKYIYNVNKNTTLNNFITNLDTNGKIAVYKQDKTELTGTEYVGTGMTLKVTKDEKTITLSISVIGDLDGNGEVTITDLSKMNQILLETVKLEENEYKLSADLDKNDKISVTDLSMLNKLIIE